MDKNYELGNIKLLSIDLDGTLLTKFKRITKKDLEALKTFSNLGGYIFINTGKSLVSTLKYIKKISDYINKKLDLCSCLNGNIIFNNTTQKIVHAVKIDKASCKQVFDICQNNNLGFYPYIEKNENKKKAQPLILNAWKKYIAHIKYDYLKKYEDNEAYKINIFRLWKKINSAKVLKDLLNVKSIEVLETNPRMYEVIKKDSNKGSSLKIVSDYLGLKRGEIAAIGDSANDVPMFEFAGESYLVKEKFKDLKKAVSTSFNAKKNGVSKVIYDYILESKSSLQ